jgi:hypothetical protein
MCGASPEFPDNFWETVMLHTPMERVIAGAQLLDERYPDSGWRDQIDLKKLNIGHGGECIGGQLYGTYEKALENLGITDDQAIGFGLQTSYHGTGFRRLTRTWKYYLHEYQPTS